MMLAMSERDVFGLEPGIHAFYASVNRAGDASRATDSIDDEYVLQVPEWGLEVSGGEASIAWLRSETARLLPFEIVEVIMREPFAIVLLRRLGAGVGTESCHVLRLEGDRIRSCCVVPPAR